MPVKSNSAYQNCIDSGRSVDDCQNYYKVLVQLTETDLMLCGTSSFQPMCDIRHVSTPQTNCEKIPVIYTNKMLNKRYIYDKKKHKKKNML